MTSGFPDDLDLSFTYNEIPLIRTLMGLENSVFKGPLT